MNLWLKLVAAVKDRNSIWKANLSRRTPRRNPNIDKAVIRSTSHSHHSFDLQNIDRVCEWIRISPDNLAPALLAISDRMAKSRDWVVALKSLHLMHSIVNSRLPCVWRIGRLPFDLSDFCDAHTPPAKSWPFNAFVRAYYAFLDGKLGFMYQQGEEETGEEDGDGDERLPITKELMNLQKQQALIDQLMQIKPQSRVAHVPIILDIMDTIIIEIYDVYSRICRGIAIVLINIYSARQSDAKMALELVKKATQQGEDLAYYFEFCQDLGCFYASEFPVMDKIPEEGINELEQIIQGFDECKDKAIILAENQTDDSDSKTAMVTEKWVMFEELKPLENPGLLMVELDERGKKKNQELPDLISFL